MSRKSILYISFFLLINTSLLGQSGIYLVSLSHSVSDASECKVIVTDPLGGSTLTNITHYGVNIEAHYSELNTIFNNIISTGYQLFGQLNDPYVDNFPAFPFRRRTTWVFKAPWTTAGLIPAGVNNSLLKITNVFPNPTSNVVNLKFASSSNNSKLYLIHSGGYIINEYDVSNLTDFSVNTSLLSNGNYLFVLVANGVYSESKSFIKQ